MPKGSGRKRRDVVNLESYLRKKDCIVQIKNKDELCCARAIIVAIAKYDKDPQYKYIVDHRCRIQTRLAQEPNETSGVPLGPCGIPEVKKFQATLHGCQLNVVSKEHLNALIYSGPEAEKHLYLYHHDNHYDVITSMPPSLLVNSTATNARKDLIKLPTIHAGTYASSPIHRTVPSSSGSFVKTATDSSRVTNVSIAIKMTPVLPNLFAMP